MLQSRLVICMFFYLNAIYHFTILFRARELTWKITCLFGGWGFAQIPDRNLCDPNRAACEFDVAEGCLSEFENTASFSRNYQAAQDCMCDTEHMFDCSMESSVRALSRDDQRLDQMISKFKVHSRCDARNRKCGY
jgi:Neuroendocrine protein 7B2 precursor (Secretogranin V)